MNDILASLEYRSKTHRKPRRGISKINDFLFLGGVSDIKEDPLKEHGITHIVNMAEELFDFKYPVQNLHVFRANITDSPSVDILPYLSICGEFIHEARQNGGHILVHCLAGSSRSASVVIAYLVRYMDMSLKEAFQHVSDCRDNVYPNEGFWQSLIDFEFRVRKENSVEIRPYLTGKEPDVYFDYVKSRILNGWFEELMVFYGFAILLTCIQILLLVW